MQGHSERLTSCKNKYCLRSWISSANFCLAYYNCYKKKQKDLIRKSLILMDDSTYPVAEAKSAAAVLKEAWQSHTFVKITSKDFEVAL